MELNIKAFLITNLLNGLLGIILLMLGYKLFDLLTPKWDTHEIFNGKNISNGAIVIGCFLLGLSIIIASAAG